QAGALFYIGVLLSTLVLLRDGEDGRSWVFLAILATFAVDTGAYAVGRAIGRHKLAPKISPAKTWEGAVGGYIAGAAAVFGLNALLGLDVATAAILPLALLLPPAAMAGDLLESWMKRRMGVKDASGLLPGHGGFLDRLDSILLVTPLVYGFVHLRVL
ncbi:MAG TPA: phosphatidate cytidylyltransferase, partial [Tepidiformaceae bacterium]|nr:phosphatidate cytidylyltransferase [Tepidiformaceae bacterium]